MRFNYYFLSLCLAVLVPRANTFGYNSAAHWLNEYNSYKSGLNFKIAADAIPYNSNFTKLNVNFYDAMQSLSTRGAVWIPKLNQDGIISSGENTFEDLASGLNILLSMYEASGNPNYISEALLYSQNIINSSHLLLSSETNEGYQEALNPISNAYVSLAYRGWHHYSGVQVTEEIKPIRYILKLCRIIASKNSLASYLPNAQSLVAFIEKHVWAKWYYKEECAAQMKRQNTHITCNWAFIAADLAYLSLVHNIGLAGFTTNSILDRRMQYNEVFNWFNYQMLTALNDNTQGDLNAMGQFSTVMQEYDPSPTNNCNPVERPNETCKLLSDDISHANFIISYIIEYNEIAPNSVFQLNPHVLSIINNFKNVIWKGCSGFARAPARMSEFMDGTYWSEAIRACTDGKSFENNGYHISEGFLKLGRFSCSLQEVFEDFIDCKLPEGPTSPGLVPLHNEPGYFGTLGMYAQMCLNAKLLEDNYVPIQYLNGNLSTDVITANAVVLANNSATQIVPGSAVKITARNYIHFKPGFTAHYAGNTWMHASVTPSLCQSILARMANDSTIENHVDSVAINTISKSEIKDDLLRSNVGKVETKSNVNQSNNIQTKSNEYVPTNLNSQNNNDEKNVIDNSIYESVSIFPNPNAGIFTVQIFSQNEKQVMLDIISDKGDVLVTNKEAKLNGLTDINLISFTKGIYILKIKFETHTVFKKIVVI